MIRPFCCIGWPNRKMASDCASPPLPARRLSIGTNPAIALINVDLPEPDAPINATISLRFSWSETFFRTGLRPNDFETRRTSTRVSDSISDLLADLGYQRHVTMR